ncbi:RNA polymerase II elongation factor ELL2-like isoform X2 [Dunckerocampus dactyliophorus]|uniref:RNA polymerase II elongation factor ELL2-like isoform X2 n=1 Tax=Dunckerocampus dactyliophorus TaxID=161453 RepID=UPI0024061FC5|nr:RNA polymerase II elongation factor ELL2-like isoform X2 [Dunckerocampus dactyliophorus]
MASLRQEHLYGLSCGKNSKNSSNRTLYHVKLTDTAIRALEAYQNLKANLPSEPLISFKGSQGYIKLPAPTAESPNALRVFSFYLSSDCKDQPQASFDCIHQYVSSDGREQLEGQGVIQDKITVCATEDSYQMTRERMSQVEKDSWSRSAIEIKPGASHPSKSVKFQKRPPLLPASDGGFCKPPITSRWSGSMASVNQKSLRERIIHLLALKSYRKPELLLWLERERVAPKDKAELGAILDEVAKVNPKDSSYLLRDDLYKHVRRDWPSYNEEEQKLVSRLLPRKLQSHVNGQSKNPQTNGSILRMSEDRTLHHSIARNPVAKRPMSSDSLQALAAKRQKQSEHRMQQQPSTNGLFDNKSTHVSAPPCLHSLKTDFPGTHNTTGSIDGSPGGQHGSPLTHKMSSASDVSNQHGTKAKNDTPPQVELDSAQQQQRKRKSKKHKERERLKEKQDRGWSENSPDPKQTQDKLGNCDITNDMDSEEKPDYALTYIRVTSPEQRQRYQEDFSAEYDEYKDLHTRIATITHMFVQLGAKIKSMSPGTKEHKKFPGYQEEKKRCEYLHHKLSFIKQLIVDYDVSRASS